MFFNIFGGFKAVAIIVNKYCHHISYLSSDWPMSSTIDQSHDSFQNVAVLFSNFCNSSSVYVVQTKQSKQLQNKRRHTYFLIEMGEKDMEVSLFYLIHPANSNSCENLGILVKFQCFCIELHRRNSIN